MAIINFTIKMHEESRESDLVNFSQESIFLSPQAGNRNMELYPLSPIRFEESSLDHLWNDVSLEPFATEPLEQCKEPSLRGKNGLKGLSSKIKEAVEHLGLASYKEVANYLLSSLQIPVTSSPMKDEKNIRRRVYDALNVLVAAKVIKKANKKVLPISGTPRTQDSLKHKREVLKKLAMNYTAIKNLYERNAMQNKVAKTLPYPLFVLVVDKNSSYDVSLNKTQSAVTAGVEISGEYQVVEGPELLKKIGLHTKSAGLSHELKALCGPF